MLNLYSSSVGGGNISTSLSKHFPVRDLIIEKHPEVLSILLNESCYRCAAAGVSYMEISVSVEYLLNGSIWEAVSSNIFNASIEPMKSSTPGEKPILETVVKKDALPEWRHHTFYFEKPFGQTYCFLAAFNRNDTRYFTI